MPDWSSSSPRPTDLEEAGLVRRKRWSVRLTAWCPGKTCWSSVLITNWRTGKYQDQPSVEVRSLHQYWHMVLLFTLLFYMQYTDSFFFFLFFFTCGLCYDRGRGDPGLLFCRVTERFPATRGVEAGGPTETQRERAETGGREEKVFTFTFVQ